MIQVENVSVKYGDKTAVRNVSVDLTKGNFCIIGPNGSGKTSLLKAIAKLVAFEGEITIGGKNILSIHTNEFAKMISMMQQISTSYYDFTVFDTVLLGRYAHRKSGIFNTSKNDKEAVMQCLDRLDLLAYRNKHITELSGGQLQRVFLARTLVQEPKIILLDEPTNHLDMKYQIELIEYLKKWSSTGNRQVIGVFHDLNIARHFSENFILMKNGEIVRTGKLRSEIDSETLKSTYGIDVVKFMQESFEGWK